MREAAFEALERVIEEHGGGTVKEAFRTWKEARATGESRKLTEAFEGPTTSVLGRLRRAVEAISRSPEEGRKDAYDRRGRLVEPDDVEELCEAMAAVLAETDLTGELLLIRPRTLLEWKLVLRLCFPFPAGRHPASDVPGPELGEDEAAHAKRWASIYHGCDMGRAPELLQEQATAAMLPLVQEARGKAASLREQILEICDERDRYKRLADARAEELVKTREERRRAFTNSLFSLPRMPALNEKEKRILAKRAQEIELPPRLSSLQRTSIIPGDGLVVYDTDLGCQMKYTGGQWCKCPDDDSGGACVVCGENRPERRQGRCANVPGSEHDWRRVPKEQIATADEDEGWECEVCGHPNESDSLDCAGENCTAFRAWAEGQPQTDDEPASSKRIPGFVCVECDKHILKGQEYGGRGGHAAHKACRAWPPETPFKVAGDTDAEALFAKLDESPWRPIVGERVIATRKPDHDADFEFWEREARIQQSGRPGKVVAIYAAHNKVHVRHDGGGRTGAWKVEELTADSALSRFFAQKRQEWLDKHVRPEVQALAKRGGVTLDEWRQFRGNSYEHEHLYPVLTDEAFAESVQHALANCGHVKRPCATYNEAIVEIFAPLLLERWNALRKK